MERSQPDAIAPDGSEIRLLVTGASRASLVEVTLAAAMVSRPVFHRTVEEIWFVLEGTGRVWLGNDSIRDLRPGDTVVITAGRPFQFAAGSDEALSFLCYTSPPWPGEEEAQPASDGGLGPPTV